MSKYKGNYGNPKATLPTAGGAASVGSPAAAVLSSSSSLESLVELLDSYGFDLPAMLLLFWVLVLLIVIGGINLYLTLVKRQRRIEDDRSARCRNQKDTSKSSGESSLTGQLGSSPKRSLLSQEADHESYEWIQQVIEWLYRADVASPTIITECIDAWLASLNLKSQKLTAENGIHVQFERLLRDKSEAICFSDVKVENEVNDNILTTLKATCDRLVIQVRVAASSRDLSAGQSALYEISLNKFSALLKVVCKPEDSLFVARFLERPQTKVHIDGPLTPSSEKTFSPDLIINGILNIFTSTLVDLNFCFASGFPKFPHHLLSSADATLEIPNGGSSRSRRSIERKLFVTIVKANNLALNQSKDGQHEVYCTLEINEPREKRSTSSIRKDANSPVWQDHFLFGLNDESREILFQVYDAFQETPRPPGRTNSDSSQDECLGYGIANILELKLNPSEKLSIPLQSRSSDAKGGAQGGSLEVELLLIEHKLPGASLAGDETGALSEKIISPVQSSIGELGSAYYSRDFSSNNSTSSHLDHYTRSSLNTIKSDDHAHSSEGYGTDRGITPEVPHNHSSDTLPPTRPESRASQSREPRSLIRTIRKRLSFSKRSKSVERQPDSLREQSVASTDEQPLRDERARSVPGSREPSAPREMSNGHKQESFLSLASNTSFFAENSTLVFECTVNGEKKHYIVPYSTANKRKYRRRKGIKLHVFNDHLFVAQHVSSSQECQVCTKTFPLRLGKQGYVCRECGFLTHKTCHANVESFCPANGAARLNFEAPEESLADTPKAVPSPVPEVRISAPPEPVIMNDREIA